MDRCLLCRACESACPANVPYGELIDRFRTATAGHGHKPLFSKIRMTALQTLVQGSSSQRRTAAKLRPLLVKAGLTRIGGLTSVDDGLPGPVLRTDWFGFHPAQGVERNRVDLFVGCMAELADAATVGAAIRVLNALGVAVRVSNQQSCCGAMARHAGDARAAEQLARLNRQAFDNNEAEAVLTIASGCGSVLMDVLDAKRVQDISQYLDTLSWPDGVELTPWDSEGAVFLHTPCTLKNVQKAASYPLRLINRIPGIKVQTVADRYCCGAAGSYMLEQPEMAAALRDDVLDSVPASSSGWLLTSNVGCAIHLRAGLKARGMTTIKVMHPVELMASRINVAG